METVKDEVGGNNPVLAQTIARQHPGAPGNRVYSHYSFGAAIIAMWIIGNMYLLNSLNLFMCSNNNGSCWCSSFLSSSFNI